MKRGESYLAMLEIFKPLRALMTGENAGGDAARTEVLPGRAELESPARDYQDRFVTIPNPEYGKSSGAVSPYAIRLIRETAPKTFFERTKLALRQDVEALELNQYRRELDVIEAWQAFKNRQTKDNAKAMLLALAKVHLPGNAWFPAFAEITFDFTVLAPALKNCVAYLWNKPYRVFEVLPEASAAKVAGFAAVLSFMLTGIEGLPLIAGAPFRAGLAELILQGKIRDEGSLKTFLQKGLIGLGIRYAAESPKKFFADYSHGDVKSWRNDFVLNLFIVPVMAVLMQWPGWVDTLPMAGVLSAVAATGSMRITKLWGDQPGLAAFVRSGYFSTLNAFGALSAAGVISKPEAYAIEIAVALGLFGALHLFKKK